MNIMIVVTHLLGTGHLARALTLGRAWVAAGDRVSIVSGGSAVAHFDTDGLSLIQLPSVRSNGTDFATLLRDDGVVADAAHMQNRQDALARALAHVAPDVLITELFPFGRRSLRHEFRHVLDAAQAMAPRPLTLCSIRDILAPPGKPAKAAFAEEMVQTYYDGVLVHSDPDLVPLDRSWPVSAQLAQRLHYTGFVAPPAPASDAAQHGAIVVSAGGGAVGGAVFAAACDAARDAPDQPWLLLVGGDQARRDHMAATAPANVTISPPRPDFRALLAGARASVSMCGYNTALDVLQTGVRAVLVPFDDGGEVEQGLRADALAAQPGIAVLSQNALSGPALAQALRVVEADAPRPPRVARMDGAARSVAIVRDLWAGQVR